MNARVCSVVSAVIILAGCSRDQSQLPANPIQQQAAALREAPLRPDKKSDLLYLAQSGCVFFQCSAYFSAFTYPKGTTFASWQVDNASTTGADCSDKAGNVFVGLDDQNKGSEEIIEFAHGGTTPIATLPLPYPVYATACSVDPTTGDLAVTGNGGGAQGVLFIYKGASGKPKSHRDQQLTFVSCGYDDGGNLYVDGTNRQGFAFVKFPKGGHAFKTVTLDQAISRVPGTVQWDGAYVTVLDDGYYGTPTIYRFAIAGTQGKVVGSTSLTYYPSSSYTAVITQSSIERRWVVGNAVYGACVMGQCSGTVFLFHYPQGGYPIRYFGSASGGGSGVGMAISIAH